MSNLKLQPVFKYQTPRSCPFIAFLADEYKLGMFVDWAFENPLLFFDPDKKCVPVVWLPPRMINQITAYFDACTGQKSGGPPLWKFGFSFIVRGIPGSGEITDQGYGAADFPTAPVRDVGYMELYGGYKLLEAINPIDNPAMQMQRCVMIRADSDEATNVLSKLWVFHRDCIRLQTSAVDAAGVDGMNLLMCIKGVKSVKSFKRQCMSSLSLKILVLFRDKYLGCDLEFQKIPREGNFPCDWLAHIGYRSEPSDPLRRDRPDGPDSRTFTYLEDTDLGDGFCHIRPVGCYNCGKLAHKKEVCPYIDLRGVDLSNMVSELISNSKGGPPGHSGGGGGHGSTAAGLSSSVVHSQGTSSQATSSQATSSGSAASTSAQPASPSPIISGYPPAAGGGGYSRYPPAAGGGYPPAAGGGYPPAAGGGYPPALSHPSFSPVGHSGPVGYHRAVAAYPGHLSHIGYSSGILSQAASSALSYPSFVPVDYHQAVAYPWGYSSGSRSHGSGSSGILITCQKCGLVSPDGRVCDCERLLKRK